jgi:hypothetical protein
LDVALLSIVVNVKQTLASSWSSWTAALAHDSSISAKRSPMPCQLTEATPLRHSHAIVKRWSFACIPAEFIDDASL